MDLSCSGFKIAFSVQILNYWRTVLEIVSLEVSNNGPGKKKECQFLPLAVALWGKEIGAG